MPPPRGPPPHPRVTGFSWKVKATLGQSGILHMASPMPAPPPCTEIAHPNPQEGGAGCHECHSAVLHLQLLLASSVNNIFFSVTGHGTSQTWEYCHKRSNTEKLPEDLFFYTKGGVTGRGKCSRLGSLPRGWACLKPGAWNSIRLSQSRSSNPST